MSFVLPTFNLMCNVYTFGAWPAIRGSYPCNLAFGRRQETIGASGTPSVGVPGFVMALLLPAGSDVRGPFSAGGQDDVEVPAGTGRYYTAFAVDDIGKGFANEHRVVLLMQRRSPVLNLPWPTPIP